jgi:3-dehydroquinate synthetase
VLLGMKVIHELGVKWEITDRKLAEEVNQYIDGILKQNNYLANLDLEQIQKLIWSDKKIKNKELTFIVLKTIGNFEFVRKLPSSNLTKDIENAFKRL